MCEYDKIICFDILMICIYVENSVCKCIGILFYKEGG